MATINKLIAIKPQKDGNRLGYALAWLDSPNSPTWLAKKDFEAMQKANLTLNPQLDQLFADALAADFPEEPVVVEAQPEPAVDPETPLGAKLF